MISDALLHKGGELVAVLNVFQGQQKNQNAIIVEGFSDWMFWRKFRHENTNVYAFSKKRTPKDGPKTNKEAVQDSLEKIAKGIPTRTGIERLPEGCAVLGIVDEDHDILLGIKTSTETENPRVFLTTTHPFRDLENMLLHHVDTPFEIETEKAKELVRKIGILRTIQQKKRLEEEEDKVRWDLSFKKEELYKFLKEGDIAKLIEGLRKGSNAHHKLAPVDEWMNAFREGQRLWGDKKHDSKTIQGHDWVCGIAVTKFPTVSNRAHFKKHEKEIEMELVKAEKVIEKMNLTKRIRKKEKDLEIKFLN